jgi:hypothetical protein
MTTAIIVIVVIAILALILAMVVMPRARARARERELENHREEVAGAHRDHAQQRLAKAEVAEHEAARERAEAELHESRARLHEQGLADDDLDTERDRLTEGGNIRSEGDRFRTDERETPGRTTAADDERVAAEHDAVPPEERRR